MNKIIGIVSLCVVVCGVAFLVQPDLLHTESAETVEPHRNEQADPLRFEPATGFHVGHIEVDRKPVSLKYRRLTTPYSLADHNNTPSLDVSPIRTVEAVLAYCKDRNFEKLKQAHLESEPLINTIDETFKGSVEAYYRYYSSLYGDSTIVGEILYKGRVLVILERKLDRGESMYYRIPLAKRGQQFLFDLGMPSDRVIMNLSADEYVLVTGVQEDAEVGSVASDKTSSTED